MVTRTTISLPDDLKARMDAEPGINWSAEAARCFEKVLGARAARKQEKEMSDVIARLKASKLEHEDASYRDGVHAGREWAMHTADYSKLEDVAGSGNVEGWFEGEAMAPFTASEWFVGSAVLSFDEADFQDRDRVHESIDAFWGGVGADREQREDVDYVRGFVDGAADIWEKVADKL